MHDVGQQEGRLFIVMELLPGEDLATVLGRSDGGRVRWCVPEADRGGPPRGPGDLVHVRDGHTVRALDRRTGEERWRAELGAPAARLLVKHGTVYAAAHHPPEHSWDVVFALAADTGQARRRRSLTRRDGRTCGLTLLGTQSGALYVRSAAGSRRTLLGGDRAVPPFVAGLDLATGRPRRQWEDRTGVGGGAVPSGEYLVLPVPELTALALPRD
ncbi:PQQ-binding-like beta-propeller repeat protein [Streptomyces sp. NPDC006326]|uniref:outer membrane protein assembly factor BamB family protein n=1 Tax=Streptomyces sp. NPDC006326 TaxID=3156752 RepID=UPI0033B69B0B